MIFKKYTLKSGINILTQQIEETETAIKVRVLDHDSKLNYYHKNWEIVTIPKELIKNT